MKKALLLYCSLVFLASCKPNRDVIPALPPPPVDGSLLYTNEFGALRVLKTTYENDRPSQVRIAAYGDVGFGDTLSFSTFFTDLGGVARTLPGTFDWSYFDESMPPYSAAVLTQRNNSFEAADHKKQSIYQWVGINQSQRSQVLTMYSYINGNERRKLQDYNYYVRARGVRFIDRTSFLVLFSDFYDRYNVGKPRPSGVGVDNFVHYIMKFDFSAPDPSVGEVVASFSEQNLSRGQLFVSARKSFYIFFAPQHETTGYSPFIVRADNSGFAYTPYTKGDQSYDRAPGHEAFAMDVHPTKDSVIAVSDNRFGTMLLRIPMAKEDRFEVLNPVLPNTLFAPAIPIQEAFLQNAWKLKFNHDGSKLVISYHVSSAVPTVAIWDIATNTVKKYTIPRVQNTTSTRIGTPAWDSASPDKRFLYFWAGDPATRQTFLFYIDTNAPEGAATPVSWDSIQIPDGLEIGGEQLRSPSDIVQRKDRP